SLHDGVVAGTAFPPRDVRLRRDWRSNLADRSEALTVGHPSADNVELILHPDPTIHDGRFANNGWLQELPKPVSKLTWDNAAIVSPATAALRLAGAQTGDMVKLTYQGRSLNAPVFIQPGHANGAITLHLGYGRTRAGRAVTGM